MTDRRRRALRAAAAGWMAVAVGGCAPGARPGAAAPAASAATVVMVSLDGFRADYLDRGLPLPAFARLLRDGARADALVPSFPSKTAPNHLTLVTGLRPGHHGIVANAFRDSAGGPEWRLSDTATVRDGRWYAGEPLWVVAERAGVRSASLFWPGSEAAIGGVRPATFLPYDARLANEARVDSVAAWLRRPPATRPRLVLLYVSTLDEVGHRVGPDAPAVDSALVAVDRVLGRLLDALAASPVRDAAHVVVASDHGMRAVTGARSVDLSACAGAPLAGAQVGDAGPVMALWYADPARRDGAHAALQACLAGDTAHARVWRRERTPPAWAVRAQPRAGDLLVEAEPGWQVVTTPPKADARTRTSGAHGWDPARDPQMRGLLVVAGPRVRARGRIGLVDNVDVAPLVAGLLGLRAPTPLDGAPGALAVRLGVPLPQLVTRP